ASKPTPAQPAAPQVAAPLVPPPPAAIVPPDLKLIGLNQSATRALLGAPAAERDGRPGKVWRYRADTCSFDVHFFFDVAKNDFYALQVVPQAPDRSAAAAQRCAESLWIARQQQAAG
ncbi:MAG TPA: hypothetical protein VEH84_09310, partial [Alphaproteobacteria bacterium]|nr:hypothetical protein [Alphaproteobacteria bacterium]